MYPRLQLLCFWWSLGLHIKEMAWWLKGKGHVTQTQQTPFSTWKLNCSYFQVEGACSHFVLVHDLDGPLRQIRWSLFEFVLGGLSHCKQRSVTAHTIACVGWGSRGTAVGRWAINIYSPGAQSLLYSSVKIQLSWHYFQRIKVGFLFLFSSFLEMVWADVTTLT